MRHVAEVVAVRQLRVVGHHFGVGDGVGRHAGGLQLDMRFDVVSLRSPRGNPVCYLGGTFTPLLDTQTSHVVGTDDAAQTCPLVVVLAGHGNPAVVTRRCEHPMGRHCRMVVAHLVGQVRVHVVVEHCRCQEGHRRFGLRQVDVLALAGAVAMVQGGQQSSAEELGRHVVGVGTEHASGIAIGPASHLIEARHGRTHRAETGQRRERPALAEQAARRHDDVGLDRSQILIGQVEVGQRMGRERLGDNVGPAHQV